MLEVEIKLAVEGSFAPTLAPERAGVSGMEELAPLDLRATYYDTPDLRLARYGITLRHRTGEADKASWTLKLPDGAKADDSSSRDEVVMEGPGNVIPDRAEDLVSAFVRTSSLTPVARLRTRRRRWSLQGSDGHEVAELVDDRVSVLQRGRVTERFRVLEVEGKGLDREGVERIARVLTEDGASTAPQVPKLLRALGPRAKAPPDVVVPDRLKRTDPADMAVRAAIARGVRRIMLNDPRVRLGEVEPLHQMRVGTRRLRSDLRTFRPLVDREWADGLREELRWLGNVLGDVRDLDVLLERLHRDAADLEPELGTLFEVLEAERARARAELFAALRTARYLELLDRLVEAAENPSLTPAAEAASIDALPPLVRKSWKQLRKKGRALDGDSTDEDYHRVRVLTKRARYGAEAISPALGRKRGGRAERFADCASDLQDLLGELQDSVVASERVLVIAGRRTQSGRFNFAAGRLVERELRMRVECRERFAAAWRRLDRPKRRAWM